MFFIFMLGFIFQQSHGYGLLQKNRDVVIGGAVESPWPESVITHDGEVKLQIDDHIFEVFPDTILRWDQLRKVNFDRGIIRVHWSHEESLSVDAPVARVSLTRGDYVIRYFPEDALVRVEVLDGKADIQGHYREERLDLEKKQKGEFRGILGPEGPTFDLLLQGRKAIRGHLKGPMELTAADIAELIQTRQIEIKPPPKKIIPKPKPGQICREPFAKFNECVVRCQGNPAGASQCRVELEKVKCLKERCAADGRWTSPEVLFGDSKKLCRSAGSRLVQCDPN